MTIIRTQVTIPRAGNLPENSVVNTWTWDADTLANDADTISTNYPGLRTRIRTFYEFLVGRMGNGIDGTVNIKGYNLADAKPRAPFDEFEFEAGVGSGTPFPAEVALCLSFAASKQSGLDMARRRGRVYLGPLAASVAGTGISTGDVRPTQAEIDAILNAAQTMATGSGGAFRLAVYSPTSQRLGATLGNSTHDVVQLSMDDAFDTMRSRGARPTTRTTRVVS